MELDDIAMDGDVPAEAATAPAPAQHPLADQGEAHVRKPVVLETCDETDRLLAGDDSSQEYVPEADDVGMENGAASVQETTKDPVANAPESAVCEGAVDAEKTQLAQSAEPSTPPKQTLEGPTVSASETPAEDAETNADERPEHASLADERRWYGELPAFVKRAYGLATESVDAATGVEFPVCSNCCEDGKPRAMSSVCCQEEQCAFQGVNLCSACFADTHATAIDRRHRQTLTKACPHCHVNPVRDWCVGCDLSFCSECFTAIHEGVSNVGRHKKFSFEGTTGEMLIRSKWTPYFRAVILQLQSESVPVPAQRQQPVPHTTTHTNGAPTAAPPAQSLQPPQTLKRKRSDEPPEIICIDEEGEDAQKIAATAHQLTPQPTPFIAIPAPMPPPSSTSSSRASGGNSTLRRGSSLPVVSSRDSNGASTPESTYSFTPQSSNTSTPVNGVPVSAPYNQNLHAWQVSAVGHTYVTQPVAPPPTTVAIPSTAGRVTQADSPIDIAMFNRLNQLSQRITQLEEEVAALNRQVVQASYQSVMTAKSMMAQLETAQQQLRQMGTKRDLTVVHLVAHSKSIISKVKRLRMDLLGDIPQVHAACYRRCLQLSGQIDDAEAIETGLKHRMESTVARANEMSSEVFHRSVSSINAAIRTQQQAIVNFKEERENEIVRLVQYHVGIRETLKRAVQQTQLRRQQQDQYIQPTHPPQPAQAVNLQSMPAPAHPASLQQPQPEGLYQQFQQHQLQQLQPPHVSQQYEPITYIYSDVNSQRNSDADAPIGPPPYV